MTTGLLSWNARHFNNKLSVCEPPLIKKLPKNSELVISLLVQRPSVGFRPPRFNTIAFRTSNQISPLH
ncbi:hypothetical protein METHP14_780020 [Pseudomonas sp. P14-2025]